MRENKDYKAILIDLVRQSNLAMDALKDLPGEFEQGQVMAYEIVVEYIEEQLKEEKP